MASKDGNHASSLPIPDTDGLIITRGADPGKFTVELDSTNVVKMTIESELALLSLIVPDLNLMIVTTRNEHRLGLMEADTTNRTIVVFKLFKQYLCLEYV